MKLSIGASVHAPVGRRLFNVLPTVAESEFDLIRARTREGKEVAKTKGLLPLTQRKITTSHEAHLVSL
ncbi:hypothetical protein [Arthrobacter sp. U41]|uniref:hypothetical protein n=1 Tax=Arthrobacter sp. U41 TaxID=1849032 RepID=UPI000859469A|nr:hypothetical protein ASPU41_21400 [Arthrobacter sp. U41]